MTEQKKEYPMGPKPGDRYVAVMEHDIQGGKVRIFGVGTIQDKAIPPDDIKFIGVPANQLGEPIDVLALDNGKTVWHCECSFHPLSHLDHIREAHPEIGVEEVDIEWARANLVLPTQIAMQTMMRMRHDEGDKQPEEEVSDDQGE